MTREEYLALQSALEAHPDTTPQAPQADPGARRLASQGVFKDTLAGGALELARRLRLDPGIQAPDTQAAQIGQDLPAAVGSIVLPGSGLAGMGAQAGGAALWERLRPGSDWTSTAMQGGAAGLMTGAGDLLGRAVSGAVNRFRAADMVDGPIGTMANRVRAAIGLQGNQVVRSQSERLTRMAETFGGMGAINQAQQRVVTNAWVDAIGEQGTQLTPDVRRAAAERIGAAMDAALPQRPVDITDAFTVLDDIPAEQFPGKARLMGTLARAENDPAAYQQATRDLRDAARSAARGNPAWADEFTQGLDALMQAGEDAGAASTRIVREQYKNLMLLESIPTVRRTGHVPVLSAEQRVFTKYSPGTARRAGEGTLPATQRAIEVTQAGAQEAALRFKSSGTAERGVEAKVAMDVADVATGGAPLSSLLKSLGPLAGSRVLGTAAVGTASPNAGRLGAQTARELLQQQGR
jgi:hypothetical protein